MKNYSDLIEQTETVKRFRARAKMRAEEEEKKKEEEKNNGGKKTQTGSMTKLILVNIIFFMVVASGIMFVSGHSPLELMGLAFMHAKKKDEGL